MAGQRASYRFGFVLTTLLGNEVRYRNLRKYADLDPHVECVWAPVQHYYREDEYDPVRFLPGPLHTRAVVVAQSWPVLRQMDTFDAVMIHQFEVQSLLAARSIVRRSPIVIAAQDLPPVLDRDTYPLYPEQREKAGARAKLRLANDVWTARRAGYFVGFSEWSSEIMMRCGLPPKHVASIHVGLDLDLWRPVPPRELDTTCRLLFVAGHFARKGGDTLLDIFREHLAGRCTLDIVTTSTLDDVPPGVTVHHGLEPGNPKLVALFASADILVLPTIADLTPWVLLEAMASGCAVATSGIGGIPDMMTPDCGNLFDPYDRASIVMALEDLVDHPERRAAMGRAGRVRIEQHYNARINVPLMLDQMKAWVDERRDTDSYHRMRG